MSSIEFLLSTGCNMTDTFLCSRYYGHPTGAANKQIPFEYESDQWLARGTIGWLLNG